MKRLYVGVATVIIAIFAVFALQQNMVSADVNGDTKIVPIHKNWTVTFSKSMNGSSFTEETVRVTNENGEKVEVTYELANDGKTLQIHPPEKGYMMNHQFTLFISHKVTSQEGHTMARDFHFNFETRDELPAVGTKENFMSILAEMEKNQRQLYQTSDGAASDETTSAEESSKSSENDTSETNTQVEGVDEGDILKTDGEHFYFARRNDIMITKAHPAEDSELVSTISEKNVTPEELYIYEDRLVMLGHKREALYKQEHTTQNNVSKEFILPYHRGQTVAYIYDVSKPSSPQKVREIAVQGNYKTSRLVDENLYFITNEHPPFHIMTRSKEDGATEQEDPRPRYKDSVEGAESKPIPYDRMHKLPGSNDSTFLTITSLDITQDDQAANVKTYLGTGQDIYMSKDHIYMAVRDYPNVNEGTTMLRERPTPDTKVYQFGVDGVNVTYDAETTVPGTLINQFAMDERNGTFRVATTKGNMWDDETPSTNNIYTFDSSLNPLGKVEGLAEGERIYSVRFMQDRAYLVTFKQVDPLFVIDLQNPEKPKVLGKLKIPGFSNYLHPIDENHVIGFGKHTKQLDNDRVVTDGVKLSLFDISDVTNPIEKDVEIIGGRGSNSELNYNHKALYYHPEKELFGFPVTVNESYEVQQGEATYMRQRFVFEGAYLYKVTPEDGFDLKTTITHQPDDQEQEYPKWEHRLQRMMSINDALYSFSEKKMKVMDLTTEEETSQVEFPGQK